MKLSKKFRKQIQQDLKEREKEFRNDLDAYKYKRRNAKQVDVKNIGHTLITADSLKELQAKVDYEKQIADDNSETIVVYSAVVSSFSVV